MKDMRDISAKGVHDEEVNALTSAVTISQPPSSIKLVHNGKTFEVSGEGSGNESSDLEKQEQSILGAESVGNTKFSNITLGPHGSLTLGCDDSRHNLADKAVQASLSQGCLDISLGTLLAHNMVEGVYDAGSSQDIVSLSNAANEVGEQSMNSSVVQQFQRSRCLLPKPSRVTPGYVFETSKDVLPHMRLARPPAEGRGRAQLLPRYWPRITDQELRQISGDSNSTIVPLFEKVLSASDAGRIGRLVLPKACAEAYFPPISQPEGLPLKIQDAKGKDWVFQFRFWPNNNSRMYVLEGVTPCIQSMQLQAGDTVTFSRIDPEGKLVMGFRKATNTVLLQDSQISAFANGSFSTENFLSGVIENLPIVSGYSGLYQSVKRSPGNQLNVVSEVNASVSWHTMDNQGRQSMEGLQLQHFPSPEKSSGNIGSKRKRLHIDNEDAMELKMTWDEAQNLLRPPPSINPSIVVVDDHEFEEYEEPPVFGKSTVFTCRITGELDQWAQCDICSKWRRLPVDVILSSKWTCAENTWDPKRSSCTIPDEMNPKELHNLLQQIADFRKAKIATFCASPDLEASGLDALATAASLGEDASPSTSSIAATTKHPRHRPGCTCIVCIQPPSGKGPKHHPNCTCNVCSTVKRRFKTLMMRKKKRQTEREEAEIHKRLLWENKEPGGPDSSRRGASLDHHDMETGRVPVLSEMSTVRIDLNFDPKRGEENTGISHVSMMGLLEAASLPLEAYMKQNGLSSLACNHQISSNSPALPDIHGEMDKGTPDGSFIASASRERDSGAEEEHTGSDQAFNDAAV